MHFPTFCGFSEFHRSLTHNSLKIDSVLNSFDAGCFDEAALNDLIQAARRTDFVCSELIKLYNLKMAVEAAATDEDHDLQGMHWEQSPSF